MGSEPHLERVSGHPGGIWGGAVLAEAARLKGYSVGPAISHGGKAYGVQWDLANATHVAAVTGAVDLLRLSFGSSLS